MSYTIKRTDGQALVTIPDQTIDKSALGNISLVGRNAINYGVDFAENFVYLTENFAAPQSPQKPLQGQLWYDTGTDRLRVRVGGEWKGMIYGEFSPFNLPLALVQRDANGNFEANQITANLEGIAEYSNRWTTPRVLALFGDATGSVTIEGNHDMSMRLTVQQAAHATLADRATIADRWGAPISLTLANQLRGAVTFDGSGNVTLNAGFKDGGIDTNVNGNATTATRLQTPRNVIISGAANGSGQFDGSNDVNVGITLIDVNPNVGTFNTVTVNSKGLVTSAYNADLTKVYVDRSRRADYADKAGYADEAGHALRADSAAYADRAGYADEAGKLRPGRTIYVSGAVTGQAFFDGGSDINIAVSGALGNGPPGPQGPPGPIGPQGPPGNVTAASGASNILAFYQGPGVVITQGPNGTTTAARTDQTIAQWTFDMTGYRTFAVVAYQVGSYNINGNLGQNQSAAGRVDLIIDGNVAKSVFNSIPVSIAVPSGSSPTQLIYFGAAPGSNQITVRCYGTVSVTNRTDAFSYTFGESSVQVMRFT